MSHCPQCNKLMRRVCRFCQPQDYIDVVQQALMDLSNERTQRPWVGLTGQEKALIASVSLDVHDAVHRTEDKLKEKNT